MTLYICYYKNCDWCCYVAAPTRGRQSTSLTNGTGTDGIPMSGRRRSKTAPIHRRENMTKIDRNWKSWVLGIWRKKKWRKTHEQYA